MPNIPLALVIFHNIIRVFAVYLLLQRYIKYWTINLSEQKPWKKEMNATTSYTLIFTF